MSNPPTPAINAVLAALERFTGDLRHCTEEAEKRAQAAEERAELERHAREAAVEARHAAEARAAAAEQAARDAIQRAETAETAAREHLEHLRRELLVAIQEAVSAAQEATAAVQSVARPERYSAERPDDPYRFERDQDLSHIPQPRAGRESGSPEDAPRRWDKKAGYAWVEDEPGPSWWRRLFGRRY
jgi:signal transduction protein with GAF and PtsI domain